MLELGRCLSENDDEAWLYELYRVRQWLDGNEQANWVVSSFFSLKKVTSTDPSYWTYMEQFRIELMKKICLVVYRPFSKETECHRLDFEHNTLDSLICRWKQICDNSNCDQCIHRSDYRFMYIANLVDIDVQESREEA